jgi:hypothetical protein
VNLFTFGVGGKQLSPKIPAFNEITFRWETSNPVESVIFLFFAGIFDGILKIPEGGLEKERKSVTMLSLHGF